MDKLFPISRHGFFPVFAVLLLVALSATTNVQRAAGAACSFTVINTTDAPLTGAFTIGGGGGSGDFELSGKVTMTGPCGSIHTNSGLKIGSSDVYVEGGYTYSGSLVDNKGQCASPPCYAQVPAVPTPEVDPTAFAQSVDYQLRDDGRVYQADGSGGWTQIANANSNAWNGWIYSSGGWDMANDDTINGSYFIEGNCLISGNPGYTPPQWEATLIATGFIEMSGNAVMATNPGNKAEIRNLLFVAGTDLKINGNPDQSFEGLMAAHEQVAISGNPNINGCILAEDAAQNDGTIDKNFISGDLLLHCSDCTYPSTEVIDITEPF